MLEKPNLRFEKPFGKNNKQRIDPSHSALFVIMRRGFAAKKKNDIQTFSYSFFVSKVQDQQHIKII